MKKLKITIIAAIILLFTLIVPTISFGAAFSEALPFSLIPEAKHSEAWFTGIFHAMRKYQGGWVDSEYKFWQSGNWVYLGVDDTTGKAAYGEWGNEVSCNLIINNNLVPVYGNEKSKSGLINYVGGLCYGHSWVNDQGKKMIPRAIITLNSPNSPMFHQYDKQVLAYAARRSWENKETGSSATYKNYIKTWINNHASYYGITVQSAESGGNLAVLEREAAGEISGLANEKFKTTSVDGEGATQTIEYKNGNTFIGPYNLSTSYGGLTIARITKRDNGGTIDTYYGSIDGNNIIALNQISEYNGNNFYIVVQGNLVDSVQKIELSKNFNYNAVRAVFGEGWGNGGQNIGIFYGEKRNWTSTITLPGVPYSMIKIKKVDPDRNNMALPNIGFILYNETEGKWVKSGTPAQYVDKKEDAETFYTDKNGEITIKNLNKKGKYILYEVVNPYWGYEVATYDDPSQEIITDIQALGQTANLQINNKRKYVKISGLVWEDMISGKTSKRNYLYQSDRNDNPEEKKVGTVKVTLKKADGTVIDTKTTVMNESSDKHGTYIFGDYENSTDSNPIKKIEIADLEGAYIEFEYNGMCYQSVPVANETLKNRLKEAGIFTTNDEEEINQLLREKGSKATDEIWRKANFTNNFATIENNQAISQDGSKTTSLEYTRDTQNYKSQLIYGDNNRILYGYNGQTYPVTGVYDKYKVIASTKDASPSKLLGQDITIDEILANGIEEIGNINLGLEEREMPDLIVIKDLQEAKVQINGYGHRYQYADRFEKQEKYKDGFNVGVKFGNERGKESYSRAIYPSDVTYTNNGKNELEVYVTYRIQISNEATNVITRLNSLVDYYDNNYQLEAAGESIGADGSIQNPIKWTQVEVYNDAYNKTVLSKEGGWEIEPQKNTTIYVQFKMNREKVADIIFDANGQERNENERILLDNVVEINSYSSIEKQANGTINVYAGVDSDSNPGNAIPGDKTTYEDDTEKAPDFKLYVENARKITGTVFLDGTEPVLRTAKERLRRWRV